MPTVNYWAIVVVAMAAFVMGAIWYSPLLLKTLAMTVILGVWRR
jgi:hypothetical protein